MTMRARAAVLPRMRIAVRQRATGKHHAGHRRGWSALQWSDPCRLSRCPPGGIADTVAEDGGRLTIALSTIEVLLKPIDAI
jgi:hypothetical protein